MLCTCKNCAQDKDSVEFYLKDKKTGRLDTICKACRVIKVSEYASTNKEKIASSRKRYYKSNKIDILEANRSNGQKNKIAYYETKKIWRAENKDKVLGYRRKMKKKRKDTDILYKFKENLRTRYYICLKRKSLHKTSKFSKYLGCDLDTLKTHLSLQFKDGMNWDNYGKYGWHIDHIIPLDSAKTEKEVIPLLHYTNLQPLWARDNYRKKNKCLI